jgi:hypothetical protein
MHRREPWLVGRLAGFDGKFHTVHKFSLMSQSQLARMIAGMCRFDIDLTQETNPANSLSISR